MVPFVTLDGWQTRPRPKLRRKLKPVFQFPSGFQSCLGMYVEFVLVGVLSSRRLKIFLEFYFPAPETKRETETETELCLPLLVLLPLSTLVLVAVAEEELPETLCPFATRAMPSRIMDCCLEAKLSGAFGFFKYTWESNKSLNFMKAPLKQHLSIGITTIS